MYTAASFFSGIGGLDLAFSWSGFDIRLQVEIDAYCRKVLWKNRKYWMNAKQLKDIKSVTKNQVGKVDVMFGGFPCQDISIAGKRAGITKQTRSGLWFEFLRLIRQVRPRVVVLENVAAVHVPTTDDNGYQKPSPAAIVTATLTEVGYDCIWLPIRASDIGAKHNRERWFCLAISNTASIRWARSLRNRNRKTKAKNRVQEKRCKNREFARMGTGIPRRSRRKTGLIPTNKQSRMGRNAHGISKGIHTYKHEWVADRGCIPTKNEPEYLTSYTVGSVARNKALGNAVVPQQAFPIAMAVKAFLEGKG